ncbi:MAG: PQQ-dependent sugar dehydrogenase [Actinomycetota bacterium]|nr:PQQ-dependent sugar dehydrogenase [Actinomycetota bacterium]
MLAGLLTAILAGVVPAAPAASERAALRLERVATVDSPVHVAAPRSEPGRVYVVEQVGRIRVLVNGRVRATPFLDIRGLVASGGERGLLSVAFHPGYARNRRFYVNYTDVNGDTRVVEYRSNGTRALTRTARRLLFVDQPYPNHNGGQLAFGPDGLLYVGMGDGGAGGDPENRAQNLGDRLGKLLRLNVNRRGSRWQMVGYGLRNPWRFSFDRANGDLYVADVGQNAWEEVHYTPRRSPGLENYGWDVYEGRAIYERKAPSQAGRLVFPIHVYANGPAGACSVTGGFVYRGRAIRALRGRYVFGDFCSGTISTLRVSRGRAVGVRRERIRLDSLSSFGEDARGELYATSLDGGVYRIRG